MKNVKIEMTNSEIQTLRGIIFNYYSDRELNQSYMCEEERLAHESLESKLAKAEDESFRS